MVAGVHHLFFAPLGTTLPTTVGSAPGVGLDAAFTAVGYTADTGAAFAVDTQTTNLFASQSLDPIRTIVQSKTATIQAPLIEWSASSLTAAFGGGTITAPASAAPAGDMGKMAMPADAKMAKGQGTVTAVDSLTLDIVDGDERIRLVVERGIVAGSVSATLVKNAFATLPITFTALAPVDQPTAWHLLGSNDAFAAGS